MKGASVHTAAQSRACSRRELASYGIKLPSQREAEQRARQAERDPHYDDELLSDEEADAMEQDELARQFAATSSSYGHRWEGDNATDDDEADAAAEAELARQFAATQRSGTPSSRRAPTRSRRQIMNSRR